MKVHTSITRHSLHNHPLKIIINLLAMISAIGLGRVTTSREFLKYSPPKDRDKIFYLIDKDSYQKNRQRQEYVYGDVK